MVDAKARIENERVTEAVHQHAGCDQQNHRHCHLADHQGIACYQTARCGWLSRFRTLQRGYQRRFRALQRRRESKDDRAGHGAYQAKKKYPAVELRRNADGQVGRNLDRLEKSDALVCKTYTDNRSHQRQQHALGQQLADKSPACGAERQADSDFSAAPARPPQHQVRDVRAGDDQHYADQREQEGDEISVRWILDYAGLKFGAKANHALLV